MGLRQHGHPAFAVTSALAHCMHATAWPQLSSALSTGRSKQTQQPPEDADAPEDGARCGGALCGGGLGGGWLCGALCGGGGGGGGRAGSGGGTAAGGASCERSM